MNKNKNHKTVAVLVAAGKGLRMGGNIPKQYLDICGSPVLSHTLTAFEKSSVDSVVIVCPEGDREYVLQNIVADTHSKVSRIISGGAERFESCQKGIEAAMQLKPDYILIHDGVRALVTVELIENVIEALSQNKACVPGVKLKDTIRQVGSGAETVAVPDRSEFRIIQTPQGFKGETIAKAYEMLMEEMRVNPDVAGRITDDAMVYERYNTEPVFVSEGSYENIKITTPEDILLAEAILRRRENIK